MVPIAAARLQQAAALTFSDVSGWRLTAELDRLKRSHDVVLIDTTADRHGCQAGSTRRHPGAGSGPTQPARCLGRRGYAEVGGRREASGSDHAQPRPPVSRLRDAIAADLESRKLPLLRSSLGNRTGFASAFAEGLGVSEAAPRSTAAAELRELLDEC